MKFIGVGLVWVGYFAMCAASYISGNTSLLLLLAPLMAVWVTIKILKTN